MPTKRTSFNPCERINKRDRRHHKSVFEDCHLPEDVDLAYHDRGVDFLHGCKRGSYILCFCCFTKVSPSQFEFHAGFGSRRKPYTYIRVICTGETLHDLATRLSGGGDVENYENHCNACNQGGDLLHCNRCFKFFHKECKIPHFQRYCTSRRNAPSMSKSADRKVNTQEATTDKRADPIKEIGNQDIQGAESDIVQIGQTSCYLCRGIDFQNEPFGPSTMLLCDQCERECHVGCLKKHNLADLKELPKGHWFCTISCQNIHSSLHDLLKRGQQKLSQSAISTMRKKHMEEGLDMTTDFDVSWQLLSGQISGKEAETNQLLTKAAYVLQKGFALLSCGSRHSLIRWMVHGENMDGEQFYGMHCAVLLVKSKIVSVAVFRLFGQELAEMPLITTRSDYRRKGYFHALLDIICGICRSHNVKSILLPDTEAAEGLWLKLGFKRMTDEQITAKREFFPHIVEFSDAVMLEKHLPQRQLSEVAETDPKAKTSIDSLASDDCSVINLENRHSFIRGVSNREDNSANRLRGRGDDVQMHDNHCNTYNKGGDLLHCSRCLKSFHIECTSLMQEPHSEWLCTSGRNASRRGRSVDSKVITQVATIDEGVEVNRQEAKVDKRADPIKQTNNQDIVESDIIQLGQTSCYLCRGIDFQNEPFGPSTMLLCDQCDRESHVGCLKAHNLADLNELPKGHWFCTISCQNIHFSLHALLKSGTQKLSQSALSTMINKHMQQSLDFAIDFDMSWRLLSGPISCKETETNQLLKKAISVLQKGFGLLSCGSRQSLIRQMVHGENVDGLQFYGMHCAVLLEKGPRSKIVSAAVFQLFGQEVAELPLITTHPNHRGKGYFHALFDIIRGICESHNVKSIVLPATEAAQGLWFNLGFKRMTEEQIIAKRDFFPNIVEFSDVVMLEMQLPYHRLSDVAGTDPEAYTCTNRLTNFG